MPLWLRQSLLPTLILSAMLITLAVLAWLQYGWSTQIAEALQQRMRAGLASSVQHFQTALQQDLTRIASTFEVGTAASSVEMKAVLLANAREWSRSGTPHELVSKVYLVQDDVRGDWQRQSLDVGSGRFTPERWPSAWTDLAVELSANAEDLDTATPRLWHHRPWIMASNLPILFRAVASEVPDANDLLRYRLLGYILVELDEGNLETRYLPQMVERYFRGSGDPDYRVAIIKSGPHPVTIYDSHPAAKPLTAQSADEAVELLAPSRAADGKRPAVAIRESGDAAVLELLAQHRSGSLDAAVNALRRRNLAVSFGVLLVLCAGMAFLAVSAQRAQQLARLQVDFVAGFSHEMRTPVASVCMIAENMTDGVVSSEQQIRHYGSLLQAQARRLRTMVEEVLAFAAHQKRKPTLDVRPVNLAQVMASALSDEYPLIEAAGIEVEEKVAPDLPDVLADAVALRTCIGNLLSNAVKYGKSGAWIGIHGETVQGRRNPEVRLTVQDRGQGIDAGDRRHIFEPFFRGAKAREAQTPGAGLGLSLVRQMMEAMGGRVTVQSEPGRGASFTLHLMAADMDGKTT
ncbi:MAG: HAMP domain-containing sensor histidine kinase [Bryobacteraceae bacterium]